MKISKQTWYIIGGSAAILGILGYLYISNKSKKAALAAAQAKLAAEEAKGPTVVTKYITVAPKTSSTSSTSSSSTSSASKPLNTSTWTVGDIMYANYDNVVLTNATGKLTYNDGDVIGTFDSMETVNGVQLAHIKNPNGKIYYVGATFLTN